MKGELFSKTVFSEMIIYKLGSIEIVLEKRGSYDVCTPLMSTITVVIIVCLFLFHNGEYP